MGWQRNGSPAEGDMEQRKTRWTLGQRSADAQEAGEDTLMFIAELFK